MKRRQEKYALALLQRYFFIAFTDDGWRVFNATDRSRPGHPLPIGSLADTAISQRGYRSCQLPKRVFGKHTTLQTHVVIWVLANGREIPDDMDIDHQDRNTLNNDPDNLKLKPHRSNWLNSKRFDGRKTLNIEMSRRYSQVRYVVRIGNPTTKKRETIGYFRDLIQAQLAADKFILRHFGPDAPTNQSLGLL